MDNIK